MEIDESMQVNIKRINHEEPGSLHKWSPFSAKHDGSTEHQTATDFLQPKQLDFSEKPDAFMA